MTCSERPITRLLNAWSDGDGAALDELTPWVMGDLRRLARWFMARQAAGHTLQPTAVVNEAYVRLIDHRRLSWDSRAHFLGYMATIMRRLLANHARDRAAARRGGGAVHVPLIEGLDGAEGAPDLFSGKGSAGAARQVELLDLMQALRELSALDRRQGQVVELRYFVGLSVEETAAVLGISPRTVKREWHTARLWLLAALG